MRFLVFYCNYELVMKIWKILFFGIFVTCGMFEPILKNSKPSWSRLFWWIWKSFIGWNPILSKTTYWISPMSLLLIWTKFFSSLHRKMFEYHSMYNFTSEIRSPNQRLWCANILTGTFIVAFILALKFKICYDVSSSSMYRIWS